MLRTFTVKGIGKLYTTYYTLDDTADYFYGSLLIKTSQIYLFDIMLFADGLFLRIPDPNNPSQLKPMVEQPKMFEVFNEQHRWNEILGVITVGEFNDACSRGYTNQLINVSDSLQGKNKSQTWAICQKPFNIVGVKRNQKGRELVKENYRLRSVAVDSQLSLEELAVVLQEINGQIKNSSGYLGGISLHFNLILQWVSYLQS